jgi:O-antigen/teichoic acid export membrane protein
MRRFFAQNLIFVVGINLLVKPVWVFVIDRNVQNSVGHASFGTYQALLNLAIVFQIVLDFGLNSYNTRTISVSPQKFAILFPQLLTARVLLMTLYTAVVLLAGFLWGYRGGQLVLLAGIILLQSLSILLMFIRSNVAALQRFKLDGVLSVIDRFLMIGICGALLFLPATAKLFRIEWFVWTQIACYAIAVVTGFIMLRRIVHMPHLFTFRLKPVLQILKQGGPYALLAFLMSIYMRSDAFLVERLCGTNGPAEAGIYASAFRLLDVSNMIAIMFASVLMPLFGRMISEKQSITPIIRLSANVLLPATFLLAVAGWTMGTDIMHLLYKDSGAYDGRIFAILMSVAPAYSIMYIYSTLLTANGHISLLNKLAGSGAVLSLVLNLLLIPRHMALGAAITSLVTQWVLAAGYIYYAARKNELPTNLKWIAAHVAYLLLLAAGGYVLSLLPLLWLYKLVLLVLLAGILVLVFRFISLKALKGLLSKG